MIKDLKLSEIFNSQLKQNLIKNQLNGFNFISFFGSFYISTDRYLPICSNNFLTSTDLFGFYQKIKYEHIFTAHFEEKISLKRDDIEIVQNCFVVGSTNNYYHDLIDCFSRIFAYDKDFIFHKKINKIAVNDTNTVSILKEMLDALNIKLPIITLKNNKIYKFENSNITANRNIKRIIKLYRKFFLPKKIYPKYNLFVSRKDSNTRIIENEPKIVSILRNFSFNVHTLSGKSLKKQIEIFSSSKLIISMHGAALTNLLFTSSDSIVIEITGNIKKKGEDWISERNSKIYNNYTRSIYNLISSECKINHYFYFAKMIHNTNEVSFDFQKFTNTNLVVNENIFKNFLLSIK